MIRILTDSASDILPAEAEQLGVTVIPLNVTLEDGTVLRDGVDMTPTVYYGVMARCHKLPTTSQPSPELFQRFFLEAAAAGDEVVVTNWISTTKIQKISEITNFFRHYFLSRTEVILKSATYRV